MSFFTSSPLWLVVSSTLAVIEEEEEEEEEEKEEGVVVCVCVSPTLPPPFLFRIFRQALTILIIL